VASTHGVAAEQRVTEGEPLYLLSESYPDERFNALVERACRVTGLERDALLHDFGVYTATTTFARLYPALFAMSQSARAFLLTVERPIHELARTVLPTARPPELAVSELDEGALSIVYNSPRRMCALLRGLVQGTALHYGETIDIQEHTCMRRGDQACTFEIRFDRS
jgi:Haem-NO-binding